jgi:hypothetical protein
MAQKKCPLHPARPELLCWGCDKYCAASDMMCGNGSDRTQHPYELFGEDWQSWGQEDSAAVNVSPDGQNGGECLHAAPAPTTKNPA